MRRSIYWPPRLDGGALRMTADPEAATIETQAEELVQIIALSLLDGRSTNPFQQADGLGIDDPTFGADSVAAHARLRARVRDQFARLERARRARLVGVQVTRDRALATSTLEIEYENLETNRRERMEVSLGRA